MKKRILASALALTLAFGGFAADGIGSVIADEITASAATANAASDFKFDIASGTIDAYYGKSTSVVIPSTINGYKVLKIGKECFKGTNITSVVIPDSVKKIEDAAFLDCTSLTSVQFSKNLNSIGKSAFVNCSKLASISLPNSLQEISSYAFFGCINLKKITIPYNVENVFEYAFGYYDNFKYVASVTINYYPNTDGERYAQEWYSSAGLDNDPTINALHISMSSTAISGIKNKTYTGGKVGQASTIVVKYNGKKLTKGVDYKLTYSSDIVNVGTKTVTISGLGAFSGSVKKTYKVTQKPVSQLKYSYKTTCIYTGKAITPAVVIKCGSKTLKKGTDYTIKYTNNKKLGVNTAKITVTGKGNFTGTATKSFSIKRNIAKATATITTKNRLVVGSKCSYVYKNGAQVKPAVKVKYGSTVLKKGTDYTVSYLNNINPGKATIVIKGKGKYTGTLKKYFYVAPSKVTGLGYQPGIRNMGVSWQSVTGADGYQIKYSSRKDFKTYKYVPSYSIYSDTDAVISDYDLSKRYYFKVRAYKTVNGKKIYGNWSAAKAFKYYY